MVSPSPAVELAVYACFADMLLFVPAQCTPPREAEAAFGPLSRIGRVAVDEPEGVWESILAQIDRHLFATVPRSEGELLVSRAIVRPGATPAPAVPD